MSRILTAVVVVAVFAVAAWLALPESSLQGSRAYSSAPLHEDPSRAGEAYQDSIESPDASGSRKAQESHDHDGRLRIYTSEGATGRPVPAELALLIQGRWTLLGKSSEDGLLETDGQVLGARIAARADSNLSGSVSLPQSSSAREGEVSVELWPSIKAGISGVVPEASSIAEKGPLIVYAEDIGANRNQLPLEHAVNAGTWAGLLVPPQWPSSWGAAEVRSDGSFEVRGLLKGRDYAIHLFGPAVLGLRNGAIHSAGDSGLVLQPGYVIGVRFLFSMTDEQIAVYETGVRPEFGSLEHSTVGANCSALSPLPPNQSEARLALLMAGIRESRPAPNELRAIFIQDEPVVHGCEVSAKLRSRFGQSGDALALPQWLGDGWHTVEVPVRRTDVEGHRSLSVRFIDEQTEMEFSCSGSSLCDRGRVAVLQLLPTGSADASGLLRFNIYGHDLAGLELTSLPQGLYDWSFAPQIPELLGRQSTHDHPPVLIGEVGGGIEIPVATPRGALQFDVVGAGAAGYGGDLVVVIVEPDRAELVDGHVTSYLGGTRIIVPGPDYPPSPFPEGDFLFVLSNVEGGEYYGPYSLGSVVAGETATIEFQLNATKLVAP